MGICYS